MAVSLLQPLNSGNQKCGCSGGRSLLAIKGWNKVQGGEPQGLCTAEMSKRVQSAPSHSVSKTEVKEEKGPLAAGKGN